MFGMFLLGFSPILWLIVALIVLKLPGHYATLGAAVIAFVLSVTIFKLPLLTGVEAIYEGLALAAWPIIATIIAAIFTYNICLKTGAMETIKKMFVSVSNDKRVLVLLIGWGFGGFMEGMAGFGTAIAIPASMLVALGFNPVLAALVCLIANGTPTSFGSIGIPTTTLANVTELNILTLTFNTLIQLMPFMILSPFVMVFLTSKSFIGKGSLKSYFEGVGIITLLSGVTFFLAALLVGTFIGPDLAVVFGSVVAMASIVVSAKKLKPAYIRPEYLLEATESTQKEVPPVSLKDALKAWSPFIFIFVLLLGTSKLLPSIHQLLATYNTTVQIVNVDEISPYVFNWISAPVVWIILSAIIAGLIQGATLKEIINVFIKTIYDLRLTILTMFAILATAKLMGYSGMVDAITTVLVTTTGAFYPLFSPVIGALGTFVTGSGTSSGVLFGRLQSQTAIALNHTPEWIAASNSAGVSVGKMLSPQSIAIATGTTNAIGKESELMKRVMPWALFYLVGYGVLNYLYITVLGM
ncbi:L-lactate permease [Atopobacter phocae]|uniref:L-lactate permease n=1 Tax=Atopobacter phocae TaxID=136492 RepID=UPI00046F18F5|nr:L-lactate permease [Atopobacter phocae]